MGRRRERSVGVLVALALAVLSLSFVTASVDAPRSDALSKAVANPDPVRVEQGWVVDQFGRVVISHGFNLIQKTPPYYPPVFSDQDAAFLVANGVNVMRIGFMWTAVEPQPGQIDEAYIDRIVALNDLLGRYGIRTLVDFHQDVYSETYSGYGAPGWASIGDSYAEAFQHFWNNDPAPDGVGLQDHFIAAWQRAATALEGSTNLIGYDMLNEPSAGSGRDCDLFQPCPGFERDDLAPFYGRVVAGIREVDPTASIWFGNAPLLNYQAPDIDRAFTDDAQIGWSFHFYDRSCGQAPEPVDTAEADALRSRCAAQEEQIMRAAGEFAENVGVPIMLSEFGDSDNRVDNALMVDLAGEHFLPWTYWQYNTAGASLSPGLLLDDAQPGSEDNARQTRLDSLVVPYAQAIAGKPVSSHYDRGTRTFTVTYSTTPVAGSVTDCAAPTTIFVPDRVYPEGYTLRVTDGMPVSSPIASWVQVQPLPEAQQVTVEIMPTTGGGTAVPTSAVDTSDAAQPICDEQARGDDTADSSSSSGGKALGVVIIVGLIGLFAVVTVVGRRSSRR